ncbi:sorting nexin-16-like [Brienomyrus brachyistius]|uniref:sorting nexin-16-like n=1 Tax=Brienomyrus brachyistius TaxID=42636 RepID=UPI0020B1DC8A|nr:sorting nexin-16-like [Brienomyrus brachyistius]
MATPFVPVPVPVERVQRGRSPSRVWRTSSSGSTSTSSNSPSRAQGNEAGPSAQAQPNGIGSSIQGSAPLRVEEGSQGPNWEERPLTPTLLGYEVMEERAKFTVYKILVRKTLEESWVVFRRYTDFARLNGKLKEMFPGFRLALPPKRWFKDNYNTSFLEDRQLGLQAFLQNLVAHKDIANSVAVREFLCLDDPPGPFDSLEESRAFCETLEETNYRLQKELMEKQKEIEALKKVLLEKQVHVDALEKRMSTASLSPGSLDSPCRLSGVGSESSAEVDVECSAVEADQDLEEQENSCEVQFPGKEHSACWCGPPPGSSPPVLQVESMLEVRLEH